MRRAVSVFGIIALSVAAYACATRPAPPPEPAPDSAPEIAALPPPSTPLPTDLYQGLPGIAPKGGLEVSYYRPVGETFLQRDPRWGSAQMGASPGTVADYGCTLSSLAMAKTGFGINTDPGRLNAALSASGGYTSRGWLIWNAVSTVSDGQVAVEYHDTVSHEIIDACLIDSGGYPLVKFMLHGRVQHWVVIVGKAGTSYLVHDPMVPEREPIPLETRAPTIQSVRCVREG